MYCPVYHITMRTANCLDYQARAAGTYQAKNCGEHSANALLNIWQIKYKPCLTCPTGVAARAGKTDDSDVENLKAKVNETQAASLKRCVTCKLEKPADTGHFSRNRTTKDGLAASCKPCMKTIQARSYQRLKAIKDGRDIDQIAPNIAPKVDNAAITEQSMATNSNYIQGCQGKTGKPNLCLILACLRKSGDSLKVSNFVKKCQFGRAGATSSVPKISPPIDQNRCNYAPPAFQSSDFSWRCRRNCRNSSR